MRKSTEMFRFAVTLRTFSDIILFSVVATKESNFVSTWSEISGLQIKNQAALAHLGERQTEVNFGSFEIWRHCVRSTEAAICELEQTPIIRTYFFWTLFFPLRGSNQCFIFASF